MSYTITKEFSFEAAHRLLDHPKCGRLHGHSYRVVVVLEAPSLNNGMVRDYGDLNSIKQYLDETFDHKYLVSEELVDAGDPYFRSGPSEDMSVLPLPRSTAECFAQFFFYTFKSWYPEVISVAVSETLKTWAEFRPRRDGDGRR